ncbi:MAG: CHRD domain-containing protein [Pseudomonadota bacterium]|jgi:hypothetical protein
MQLPFRLFVTALLSLAPLGAWAGNFVAHCNGDAEVPPVDTAGQCQAVFKVRGDTLDYLLVVANVREVVAAHIHCAPEGVDGPIGVTLYGGAPVSTSGILAQGPILAPDVGNACGWVELADVIAALAAGDTYVNVHTVANPGGEVRGQVR